MTLLGFIEKASRYIKLNMPLFKMIPRSIYINFHNLPFKQAIKFPILVKKRHFYEMKGKVIIDAPVRFGMIKLGNFGGHMYPNNGIHWTQWGGTIIFKGSCRINNNSFIVQGKDSTIILATNSALQHH